MTTLYWSMGMNAVQCLTIVALIVVIVHYAREGTYYRGRCEVYEGNIQDAKDDAQKERIRQL
jgi:hypothetical protein